MLDRIGDEVARATSIVRYAAGSAFSPHTHDGGEEFLVLDGVFQDEHGDYPAGTYVRNPPTSRHTPGAELGCLMFVKLHQFDPADRTFVRIDTGRIGRVTDPERPDIEVSPLFEDARETVQLETITPGAPVEIGDAGGFEMLVLDGALTVDGEEYEPQSWLRLPPGDCAKLVAGPGPATVWVKRRHLRQSVLNAGVLAVS
jgi:anti-sigma factor ChrR (cupin superfamily)